jgi:hypothetical protein
MGEGFINWGYIVGKKNSMLHMKGLIFPMSRLFDYLRYVPCLSRAQGFQVFFQVPLVHPWTTMDAHGTDLRLKMGVQIRYNTLWEQEVGSSIRPTPTTGAATGGFPPLISQHLSIK